MDSNISSASATLPDFEIYDAKINEVGFKQTGENEGTISIKVTNISDNIPKPIKYVRIYKGNKNLNTSFSPDATTEDIFEVKINNLDPKENYYDYMIDVKYDESEFNQKEA